MMGMMGDEKGTNPDAEETSANGCEDLLVQHLRQALDHLTLAYNTAKSMHADETARGIAVALAEVAAQWQWAHILSQDSR